jgi:hypothetical protein
LKASGYSASATASQIGGSGGSGFTKGGAGASSTMTNVVSGSTTGGALRLSQIATGGAGGGGAAGGIGGAATSSLTFDDTANTKQATTLIGHWRRGRQRCFGWRGGRGSDGCNRLNRRKRRQCDCNRRGGAGGAGKVVSVAGVAAATSSATSTGTQGSATAHAKATTSNGLLATANTTATGATGSDDSTAVTQGGGVVTAESAFAQAQVGGTATTLAESNSGNQLGSSGFDGTNNNSYAFASEVPNSSLITVITGILNANGNLETALGNGAVLGLGTEGTSYSTMASGSRTYTSTIAWTLDTTTPGTGLSGDLVAGLINDQSFGSGFDSLDFNVVENRTTIFDKNFTSLSAAQAFYTRCSRSRHGAQRTKPGH